MASKPPVFKEWEIAILVIGLFALFLLSYKKQTAYISKRVKHNLSKEWDMTDFFEIDFLDVESKKVATLYQWDSQ